MEDGLLGVLVVLLVAEEYKREHVPIQHLLVEEQTALEQIRAAATLRHALLIIGAKYLLQGLSRQEHILDAVAITVQAPDRHVRIMEVGISALLARFHQA